MYRKELCLSLLKDPEQDVAENEDEDETKRKTRLKRNKVVIFLSFTSSRLFRTMDEVVENGNYKFLDWLTIINCMWCRYFGSSRIWIESGCFFVRGKMLFSCTTISAMKKNC